MAKGNRKTSKEQEDEVFPAIVAKVIDLYKVVINRGEVDGIRKGQRLLIYRLSDERIRDPITQESLGHLEIVKGTGKVVHVQERMSTIESDRREPLERRIVRSGSPLLSILEPRVEEAIVSQNLLPFDEPEIGDKVKPI